MIFIIAFFEAKEIKNHVQESNVPHLKSSRKRFMLGQGLGWVLGPREVCLQAYEAWALDSVAGGSRTGLKQGVAPGHLKALFRW